MSATPRTDRVCEVYHHSDNCEHLMIEHAQQLERELAVAVQEYRRLLKITLKNKRATVIDWCPVSEMLPDENKVVLAINLGLVEPSRNTNGHWFSLGQYPIELTSVTHWSPWPEVPEGLKGTK